jgi:hypothetical protein
MSCLAQKAIVAIWSLYTYGWSRICRRRSIIALSRAEEERANLVSGGGDVGVLEQLRELTVVEVADADAAREAVRRVSGKDRGDRTTRRTLQP